MRNIFVILFFLASVICVAQGERPVVQTMERGPYTRKGWLKGHETHRWEEKDITMYNDRVDPCKYVVKYTSCVDDKAHPGVRVPDEGYIGMSGPNQGNWYHHGFLFINLNGKSVGRVPLQDMSITDSRVRGVCQMVWDTPEALVVVKFMVLPGEDLLYNQITWSPKPGVEVKTVDVQLRCYPSYFTNKLKGKRFVVTPRAEGIQGNAFKLDSAKDAYVFYGDKIFDKAVNKDSFGPCAMIFEENKVQSASINVGSYAVETKMTVDPKAGSIRFMFADFKNWTNGDAMDFLKKNGAAIRSRLPKLHFIPEIAENFSPEEETALVKQLLAQAGDDGKPFEKKIQESLAWLIKAKAGAEQGAWKDERDFKAAFDSYERSIYRLRIEAMMNEK